AALRRPVEAGGLQQRGDRRQARLRAAHGRAEVAADTHHLGARRGRAMNRPGDEHETLSPSLAKHVDSACDRFEAAWKAGARPRIEDFLSNVVSPAHATPQLRELILVDLSYRRRLGEQPRAEDYLGRFPDLDRAWLEGALLLPPASAEQTLSAP